MKSYQKFSIEKLPPKPAKKMMPEKLALEVSNDNFQS